MDSGRGFVDGFGMFPVALGLKVETQQSEEPGMLWDGCCSCPGSTPPLQMLCSVWLWDHGLWLLYLSMITFRSTLVRFCWLTHTNEIA